MSFVEGPLNRLILTVVHNMNDSGLYYTDRGTFMSIVEGPLNRLVLTVVHIIPIPLILLQDRFFGSLGGSRLGAAQHEKKLSILRKRTLPQTKIGTSYEL